MKQSWMETKKIPKNFELQKNRIRILVGMAVLLIVAVYGVLVLHVSVNAAPAQKENGENVAQEDKTTEELDFIASGTCGDDLTWVLDENGVLTISGTGDMYKCYTNSAPWQENSTDIISVVIEDGVSNISQYAFYEYSSIVSLELPGSVNSIDEYAFYGCCGLISVEIPDGISSIGWYAFSNCTSLTSVKIADSVSTIEYGAFCDCENLEELLISENTETEGIAFRGCYGLADEDGFIIVNNVLYDYCGAGGEVVIPDGIIRIGEYVFYECTNLIKVDIPDSVTSIGSYAFEYCSGMTEVSGGNCITEYGERAFGYCTSLKAFSVPDGVTTLGDVFYGCTNLSDITLGDSLNWINNTTFYGTAYYNNTDNWEDGALYFGQYLLAVDPELVTEEFIIKNGTVLIASQAFVSCDELTAVTIPSSVKYINFGAFYRCSSLTKIVFTGDAPEVCFGCFYTLTATVYYPLGNNTWTSNVMSYCEGKITWETYEPDVASGTCGDDLTWTFTLADGNLTISGTGDMYGYWSSEMPPWYDWISYITSVKIESGVTNISNYAFSGGSAITEVVIPDSVTVIGYQAFYNCTELTNIIVPDGVESVRDSAFYGCANLTNLTVPESLTDIGEAAFRGCYGLADEDGFVIVNHILFDYCGDGGDIAIPDTVTEISGYAFQDNTDISGVTIPDSVLSIGGAAFYGCSNLSSVVLPEGITEILHIMFYYCTSLTSITIPEGVTTIGASAFAFCTNLVSVELPDGLTFIDEAAFSYCTSLTSVDLPGTLGIIGWYAFNHCTSLESVTIGDGIQYISANSFQYCSSLTSIVIPASIIQIGYRAFDSCTSLTEIYFEGDAPIFQYSEYDDEDDSMSIFRGGVVATAYYPEDNETWTEDVLQNYGGTLTWVAYIPVTEPYTITEALSDALEEAVENISAGVRSVQQIVFNEDYSGELTLAADEESAGEKSDKVLLLQTALEDEDDSDGTDAGSADNDASISSESVLELVLTGSSMIDENGEITFNITSTADGILVYGVNGDVTGDEKVDASDTLAILRGVSGRTALDVVQEGFSDVNLDGQVNSNDLLAVVKFVSGRTSSLN